MEEHKVQALHDTLAKLKKSAGLGVSSHYNFGHIKTKHVNGQTIREDGLPNNPLYFPFVKEGTYDPTKAGAGTFGSGQGIKRNFDDCQSDSDGEDRDDAANDKDELEISCKKRKKRALKIEAKRQAKLEAKRQAKLEAKRQAKLEAKREAKKQLKLEAKRQAQQQQQQQEEEERKLERMNTEHHSNKSNKKAKTRLDNETDLDDKKELKEKKKSKKKNKREDIDDALEGVMDAVKPSSRKTEVQEASLTTQPKEKKKKTKKKKTKKSDVEDR